MENKKEFLGTVKEGEDLFDVYNVYQLIKSEDQDNIYVDVNGEMQKVPQYRKEEGVKEYLSYDDYLKRYNSLFDDFCSVASDYNIVVDEMSKLKSKKDNLSEQYDEIEEKLEDFKHVKDEDLQSLEENDDEEEDEE